MLVTFARILAIVFILQTLLYPLYAHSAINTSPLNVLFIGSAHSNKAKVDLLANVAQQLGQPWQIAHQPASKLKSAADLNQQLAAYQLIILDAVSEREGNSAFQTLLPALTQSQAQIISFNWQQGMQLAQAVTTEANEQVYQYWQNAGRENLRRLLTYLAAMIQHDPVAMAAAKAPIIYPTLGLYHPQHPALVVASQQQFYQWRRPAREQPRVGLLLQRALIEVEQTALIDQTIAQLEAQGVFVLPFYFELSPRAASFLPLVQSAASNSNSQRQSEIDVLINFRNIHWANQRKADFEQLNVPVLQALTYYSGDQQQWENDPQGISLNLTPFTLVMPETAGVIDPLIVAAVDPVQQQTQIINYQLTSLVNKAVNMARLTKLPNRDKKLTLYVWGDKDVGASFLNIPDSVNAISQRLKAEGYRTAQRNEGYFTDNIKRILDPFYRETDFDQLLADNLAELMPIASYRQWLAQLPTAVSQPIIEHWGQPEDHFMAVQRDGEWYFVMPRLTDGNLLIMRQPPRSDNKNDENEIYHQGLVPINHFYLASYYYAREFWQSSAIIHLGTHGSQEYLGGKERGLSRFDQGFLAVGDTPVVYPFIVDDVGEAMQTKRRGRATVISHMTPSFAAAGLQGEIQDIHELMHQYKSMEQGGVKQQTGEQIIERCEASHLCKDMGWTAMQATADFKGFIEQLHQYLETLATQTQPLGLHRFGQLADTPLLVSTLIQMLGSEFSALAAEFEHHYLSADDAHDDDTDGAEHSHSYHQSTDSFDSEAPFRQSLQSAAGYQTLMHYVINADNVVNYPQPLHDLSPVLQAHIEQAKNWYAAMRQISELDNLVKFLAGGYIPVKTGGDPIRHPESLATGFNLYGFDPARVPTPAAFQQGQQATEQLIAEYYQEHGRYPDKLAFSLWSIETMRHYGVLESQILAAMGVKPVWSRDGRVIGTEIIPYSELKRPRVDVVMSATGLYRDAFANVMLLLAQAVAQVADLKEENNVIWQHSARIKSALLAQGLSPDDADYFANTRLFSNQSGDYGSGVDDAVWASDSWDIDSKIADNYLAKMGHAFGADDTRWGDSPVDQNGKKVSLYAQQLSGTDVAVFARSSNVFGMLSSDDPFEYFGSLSLAVRNIDGKSPQMRVANLREANQVKLENAASFMATELRSRVFHPRWIKAMQEQGYSGAVSLASRMDNFFGWQVVSPELVRADQWDEFADIYVNDKLQLGLNDWFEQVNPAAQARMIERMLEANRKDYWQADNTRLKQLVSRYSELVTRYDLQPLNDSLLNEVNSLATGFGLASLPTTSQESSNPANAVPAQPTAQATAEQVTGQVLEKQSAPLSKDEPNWQLRWLLVLLGLAVLIGMIVQLREQPKHRQLALS